MYDPFEDAEKRGRAIGEARLAKLLQKLYELGRTEDVQKAVTNKSYRETLMQELAIQQAHPLLPAPWGAFLFPEAHSAKGCSYHVKFTADPVLCGTLPPAQCGKLREGVAISMRAGVQIARIIHLYH